MLKYHQKISHWLKTLFHKSGVVVYQERLDKVLKYLFFTGLIVLAVLIFLPVNTPPQKEEEFKVTEINTTVEEVHEAFEDVPVVPEEEDEVSLTILEQKATRGEINLKKLSLQPKSTLSQLLKDAKISADDRAAIVQSLTVLTNVNTLKTGKTFYLFTDKQNDFLGLSFTSRDADMLAVLKESDGTLTPFSEGERVETLTEQVTGKIEKTFIGSLKKAGLSEKMANEVKNILEDEVDFSTDIQSGQKFDIIFEKKVTPSGLELTDRELLFIGLDMGKEKIARYAWKAKNKETVFYDARGRSAEQTLYKRPLKGRPRLSSSYGLRRHPILLYEIFHAGVDLAIKQGTPIVAGGDGVITQLGRKGAYGKYIRIKHAGGYQTAYAHMNGYASGLRVGSPVKRGDVIGYVGTTGRTTGPHLHYEVIKNNKTVDPFGTHIIESKQLTGFELEQFQSYAEQLHPQFKRHLAGKIPPVPTPKPVFN